MAPLGPGGAEDAGRVHAGVDGPDATDFVCTERPDVHHVGGEREAVCRREGPRAVEQPLQLVMAIQRGHGDEQRMATSHALILRDRERGHRVLNAQSLGLFEYLPRRIGRVLHQYLTVRRRTRILPLVSRGEEPRSLSDEDVVFGVVGDWAGGICGQLLTDGPHCVVGRCDEGVMRAPALDDPLSPDATTIITTAMIVMPRPWSAPPGELLCAAITAVSASRARCR